MSRTSDTNIYNTGHFFLGDLIFHGGISYRDVQAYVNKNTTYPKGAAVVGFFGSAGMGYREDIDLKESAYTIGKEIALHGKGFSKDKNQRLVLLTGACPGLPHEAAKGASDHGGFVIGVTAADSYDTHKKIVGENLALEQKKIYNIIVCPSFKFPKTEEKITPDIVKDMLKWRNPLNTALSDISIAIGGNYGTLYEISTALHPAYSIVGLFSPNIEKSFEEMPRDKLTTPDFINLFHEEIGHKKNEQKIVYTNNPRKLVDELYEAYKEREDKIKKENIYHPSMQKYMEELIINPLEESMAGWGDF